ncbi:hypothetical protein EUU23_07945 [Sphingorhabdus sp. IMCC26285]|uniref:Uncharacterized protein n=1 Tax=Sphingorhabdus profundilacus TaxID=2509718 RepID=A0A6I4LZZ1_9SPHN|nr:hypothetical protein [Sphingorhabdus profundilacus]
MAYQTAEEIEIDAENGEYCTCNGVKFAAKSALTAFLEARKFSFCETTFRPRSNCISAIECMIDGKSTYGCIFNSQQEDDFPSKVEEIILALVIYYDEFPHIFDGNSYFIYENHEQNYWGINKFNCIQLCLSSLAASEKSFISTSNVVYFKPSTFDWIDLDRMAAVTFGAYPYFESKYGFLEFYRAIEVGHLSSILKEINTHFYKNARKVLEKQIKNLDSDRNMFANFSVSTDSKNEFAIICRELEKLKDKNTFAQALMNNSKFSTTQNQKPEMINDQQWKGLALSYEIRCSVAHAGTNGLAIEDFDDVDEVLQIINPIMEKIALNCLGLEAAIAL